MSGDRRGTRGRFPGSLTVYRLLLYRYPVQMRRRFGPDMVDLFARQLDDAVEERGWIGWCLCWMRVLREVLLRPAQPSLRVSKSTDSPDPAGDSGMPVRPVTPGGSGFGWGVIEDLRFACRSLRRDPAFAGVLILVLGMGVGVNTSVFTVVNAYLLRPLPYPEADRVVTVRSPVDVTTDDVDGVLDARVSWDLDAFTLVGGDHPEVVRGAWVTPGFLDVYGVEPALGRVFPSADDGRPTSASVAIISHRLWQSRYGGDPDVLGRTVRAFTSDRPDDAESFTIVGVLPRDFWHFNDFTDILAPLTDEWTVYAGRLAPGMTPDAASATVSSRIEARRTGLPEDFQVQVVRTHDMHVAGIRPTLWTLQSAALLVFLIACANAAVLLLVRSVRRERELGVRRAIGASEGRLGRQLVFEGVLMAGGAGVLGVALAQGAIALARGGEANALWRRVPGGMEALHLDVTVLAATVALSAVTGALFGLVPVFTSRGGRLATSLADVGRGGSDTRGRRRIRSGLLCFEVGLSVALLTGASLMIQSALFLQRSDLGFDPSGVASGEIGLRQSAYPEAEARLAFFETLTERARGLPGVTSAGLVNAVPFTWYFNHSPMEAEGGGRAGGVVHVADAGYFETMQIDVVRGRLFSPDDVRGAAPVAVVSETVAERLWPGEDAVGRRFRDAESTVGEGEALERPWYTVAGVVRDVRKSVSADLEGDIYFSFEQVAPFWTKLLVRTASGASSPLPGLEALLADLDGEVPLSSGTDLEQAVTSAMGPSRFLATVFGFFAGFALLLSVVGLYGVMAYTARQGRRDAAIRLALGADRGEVARRFFRQTGIVLSVGLTFGVAGGVRLGRALESQLHGVSPADARTLFCVALVLSATALVATWLPARSVGAVAPATLLRDE